MKNIIVTGGAGYVGSHVCKFLKLKGFNPITIDNLSNGYRSFVKWGPLIVCDIKNYNSLNKIFTKFKPIAVIHLASNIEAEISIKDPIKFYENNISNSISLLKAMHQNNINKIIFSSSAAIYKTKNKKIFENDYLSANSPYGTSKLIVEKIIEDFSKYKNFKYIFLRYFNASGADKKLEIGELHKNETHLIPICIEAGFKKKIFNIYGTNYKTPDGSTIRDFVHVTDLANAHFLSLKYLINKNKSDVFNVGTGNGFSTLKIVEKLNKKNLKIKYKLSKRREGDSAYLVSNINKIKKKLNFKPKHSIDSILDSAVKYYKKINNL